MDKIEQLYIDSELLDIDEDNPFVIFKAGYKSRDGEVKKLQNALNHTLAGYGEQLGANFCNFISNVLEETE